MLTKNILIFLLVSGTAVAQSARPTSNAESLLKELEEATKAGDKVRVEAIRQRIKEEHGHMQGEIKAAGERGKNSAQGRRMQEGLQAMQNRGKALEQSPEWKLCLAAEKDDLEGVKAAHRAGADLNKQMPGRELALMAASRRGNIPMAQYLIENGAKMLIPAGLVTHSALIAAAGTQKDNSAMIAFLVSKGAKPDETGESLGSGMMKAAERGRDGDNNQHNIKKSQFRGPSALMTAVEKSNDANVKALLKAGARTDVFSMGFSPLMRAAQRADKTLVKMLLDHGADPALEGPHHTTALKQAERAYVSGARAADKADVIRLLQEALKARSGS